MTETFIDIYKSETQSHDKDLNRRSFLGIGAATLGGLLIPGLSNVAQAATYKNGRITQGGSRRLSFRNAHTGESEGRAVDLRMEGYSTRKVRDIASALKAGGVGYYSRSNFVHMDTGDVRTW